MFLVIAKDFGHGCFVFSWVNVCAAPNARRAVDAAKQIAAQEHFGRDALRVVAKDGTEAWNNNEGWVA